MQPLAALHHVETDALTGLQGFIAIHFYGRVVCEQILPATIRQYEAITLSVVEPLNVALSDREPSLLLAVICLAEIQPHPNVPPLHTFLRIGVGVKPDAVLLRGTGATGANLQAHVP